MSEGLKSRSELWTRKRAATSRRYEGGGGWPAKMVGDHEKAGAIDRAAYGSVSHLTTFFVSGCGTVSHRLVSPQKTIRP